MIRTIHRVLSDVGNKRHTYLLSVHLFDPFILVHPSHSNIFYIEELSGPYRLYRIRSRRFQKLCSYWLTKQRVDLGKQHVVAIRYDPFGLPYTALKFFMIFVKKLLSRWLQLELQNFQLLRGHILASDTPCAFIDSVAVTESL